MLGTFRSEYARVLRPQLAEFTPWPTSADQVPAQRRAQLLDGAVPTVVTQ
jgi:hypothetical protein